MVPAFAAELTGLLEIIEANRNYGDFGCIPRFDLTDPAPGDLSGARLGPVISLAAVLLRLSVVDGMPLEPALITHGTCILEAAAGHVRGGSGSLSGTLETQGPCGIRAAVTGQITNMNISISGQTFDSDVSIQTTVDSSAQHMNGTFSVSIGADCGTNGTIALAKQ